MYKNPHQKYPDQLSKLTSGKRTKRSHGSDCHVFRGLFYIILHGMGDTVRASFHHLIHILSSSYRVFRGLFGSSFSSISIIYPIFLLVLSASLSSNILPYMPAGSAGEIATAIPTPKSPSQTTTYSPSNPKICRYPGRARYFGVLIFPRVISQCEVPFPPQNLISRTVGAWFWSPAICGAGRLLMFQKLREKPRFRYFIDKY